MRRFVLYSLLLLANVLWAQNQSSKTTYFGKLDMINHIQMSDLDLEVVYEIELIEKDITRAKTRLEYTQNRLNGLEKILEVSRDFEDIYSKAEKKYNKSKEKQLFLINDIEEYISIENGLLYNIYAVQLKKSKLIDKGDDKKLVRNLKSEADNYSDLARLQINEAYSNISYEKIAEAMKTSNLLYEKAINKQRLALSHCLSIALENEGAEGRTMLFANKEFSKNDSLAINPENASHLKQVDDKPIINKHIVFKIQLGAFDAKIDKSKFYKLGFMTFYKHDKDFNKVLVGSYYSYRAALKARNVIVNTTDSKDAFVVAYENGTRITIEEAINREDNTLEKAAYINYKNSFK